MRKYAKIGEPKLRVANKDGIPGTSKSISKYDKLVTRNANRCSKKRQRQLAKRDINEQLLNKQ